MRKPDLMIAGPTQVKQTLSVGSQTVPEDNLRASPSDVIPTVTERQGAGGRRAPRNIYGECRPEERRGTAAGRDNERLAAIFDRGGRGPIAQHARVMELISGFPLQLLYVPLYTHTLSLFSLFITRHDATLSMNTSPSIPWVLTQFFYPSIQVQ